MLKEGYYMSLNKDREEYGEAQEEVNKVENLIIVI